MLSFEARDVRISADTSHDNRVMAGAAAMLQGHLAELRAIKSAEAAWLDRFSVLLLPAIIFLFGTVGREPVSPTVLAAIAICCFALTLWFQDMFRKERRSYYRVARSTVRLQNYLRLMDAGLIPLAFADPFPLGFGVNPNRDGTQPYSSFFRRQLFAGIGFTTVICGILLHFPSLWWCAGLVPLDALWVVRVFHLDRRSMVEECLNERGLAGASRDWYPAQTSLDDVPTQSRYPSHVVRT